MRLSINVRLLATTQHGPSGQQSIEWRLCVIREPAVLDEDTRIDAVTILLLLLLGDTICANVCPTQHHDGMGILPRSTLRCGWTLKSKSRSS
jgi:hypothetical protein